MDAVLFGALAGAFFGAFTVAIRYGLSRGVPVEVGASVSASVAFDRRRGRRARLGRRLGRRRLRDVVVFAAIGAAVPGFSQIVFVQAVRHAGAARTAVLIGVAPLLSFVLAAVFLGEGIGAGLVVGAALIVARAPRSRSSARSPRTTAGSGPCSR